MTSSSLACIYKDLLSKSGHTQRCVLGGRTLAYVRGAHNATHHDSCCFFHIIVLMSSLLSCLLKSHSKGCRAARISAPDHITLVSFCA